MLFVTTRNKRDAFTPQRILDNSRGEDGGLYIPMHNPTFVPEEVDALATLSFNECLARILNLQFHTKLTSWDVDFAVGRYPVRLNRLKQRVVMAELWHNTGWKFSTMAEHIAQRLGRETATSFQGDWVEIGIRIAVLFGIYGQLKRMGIADAEQPFDVSVVSGDFSGAISAWYARKWGLPIGNIVCCCNENSDIWNLFSNGQLRTDTAAKQTIVPEADVTIPESLERLICAVAGQETVNGYISSIRQGATYYANETLLQQLRRGMYITVVSEPRIRSTIPSVYGNVGYVLSGFDALAYAGLLDYRSRTASNRFAVILSEKAPVCDLELIAQTLNTTSEKLKDYFNKL